MAREKFMRIARLVRVKEKSYALVVMVKDNWRAVTAAEVEIHLLTKFLQEEDLAHIVRGQEVFDAISAAEMEKLDVLFAMELDIPVHV